MLFTVSYLLNAKMLNVSTHDSNWQLFVLKAKETWADIYSIEKIQVELWK